MYDSDVTVMWKSRIILSRTIDFFALVSLPPVKGGACIPPPVKGGACIPPPVKGGACIPPSC